MLERPEPAFQQGQRVRVRVNERNRMPHEGSIRKIVWHHKERRYNFYIEESLKKVSKRYFEEDLEAVE